MTEFHLPELGEGVYEAELVAWLVKAGDTVKRGQNLMEVLTDKATMEVPSPFTGTIASLKAEPGHPIKVGDVVLTYTSSAAPQSKVSHSVQAAGNNRAKPDLKGVRGHGAAVTGQELPPTRSSVKSSFPRSDSAVKAAPSVRYMAHKMGIDLAGIRGTGPGGRVLIDDLSAAVASRPTENGGENKEPTADYGKPGTRIKLQGLRRKIAEHMVQAKRTIPHYSYIDECDVTQLVAMRESLRQPLAGTGIKLTYMPFFVKAVVRALQEVPIVNSVLDEAAGEIVLHDHYHIGIAVATSGGLIVPVLRDADQKDLLAIGREVERLSAEARVARPRLEDLRGGTFTITSIGSIGGLFSTPIINHPEVAILGIGKIIKRPVYDAMGNVKPADLVYLSFSFDHRVVDGAVGAAFGNAVLRHLQQPAALLLPPV
jgi:pyruvate dehydrogenase E2 component (dihydrolipoamide acetyltransferase)/2-oxoisovalerate dehydrogenase E2 component (dihydrolipoyl transacylase)